MPKQSEAIDHPSHYQYANPAYEVIEVIHAWELNFDLGNAVKYIARAGRKANADPVEDLKKAVWYLNDEILRRGVKP